VLRPTIGLALGVAIVAVLGLLRLDDAFGGDQALFLIAGKELAHGSVLYRDFWDLKQPAIFAFYAAADTFGGFRPIAVHAFELIWNLTLGVVAWAALRPRLRRPDLATAAVLAIVGAPYAFADGSALTQVEGLVGLPLVCCCVATITAFEAGRGSRAVVLAVAGGLAAGIAILFKILFVFIVLAILGVVVFRHRRMALVSAWAAGAAIPLVLFALSAAHDGTLAEVVTTFFVLPSRIVATAGAAPLQRLADSVRWFTIGFGFLVPLGVAGSVAPRDARVALWRDVCVAYLTAAVVVVLLQLQSWWPYHLLLFVPPLGLLATLGVDWIVAQLRGGGARRNIALATLACATIALLPSVATVAKSAARIARDRPFASTVALERYRMRSNGGYAQAADVASFLREPENARGSVYVCGDPRVYLIAGRDQAVPINGWALELYPPERWRLLETQFAAIEPRFVFISNDYATLVRARSHVIASRLDAAYAVARTQREGTWYRAR